VKEKIKRRKKTSLKWRPINIIQERRERKFSGGIFVKTSLDGGSRNGIERE
jgi:hypothetical protein